MFTLYQSSFDQNKNPVAGKTKCFYILKQWRSEHKDIEHAQGQNNPQKAVDKC